MPQTALVIPCYNEATRLQKERFVSFVHTHSQINLCMVNDGSTDSTLEQLQAMAVQCPGRIFVHHLERNGGKAEAIRQAMLHLCRQQQYAYIGFLDADLSAPLEEALPLLQAIHDQDLLIVAGARVKLVGKIIHRSARRHYLGRIFATYADTLLQLRNYDTQCGLKVFESVFAAEIFDQPFISSWFFDIELFLRARAVLGREGYTAKIAELPLNEWKEVEGSKLKTSDFLKAPFEIWKIYRHYKGS